MTVPWSLSPAYSAEKGYRDAYRDRGLDCDERMIIYTDTSKEGAFREAMQRLIKEPPQALITASEAILKGALEAFRVCGIRVPEDVCMLTLGEETWNSSNTYPGVLHTSRSAYAMGVQCTELLLKDMEAPALFQKEFHLLDDNLGASVWKFQTCRCAVSLSRPGSAGGAADPGYIQDAVNRQGAAAFV